MNRILLLMIVFMLYSGFKSPNTLKSDVIQLQEWFYNFDKYFTTLQTTANICNIVPFIDQDFDSLSIPIKRAGNLILIETVIDGQSGNLIFDSGAASELVLNKTYFRNYKRRGSKTVSGVNGTIQTVDIIEIDSMLFLDLVLREKYAEVLDLSRIENRVNSKVLGFFGLQMINDYEFMIDLLHNKMQLFRIDKKGNRKNSDNNYDKFDYTQKIEVINNVIFIWAEIAGKELRFCFDTAAEKNMISHTVSKKVIQTISITGRAKLTGAGSKQKEVLIGSMNDFYLGEKKLENMEALIADISSLNLIYDTNISGVLGYDFLSQGKITLNIPKKQLYITYY